MLNNLLLERGYKVASNVENSLGFYPQELLEIIKERAPKVYADTNKFFGEREASLSCKAILDHYYKIDALLELPKSSKSSPTRIVGLQYFSYSEREAPDKPLRKKLRILNDCSKAYEEIFLEGVYVVSAYIPTYWEGVALCSEKERRLINERIDKLVLELASSPPDKVINISFE